jgi:hypothetical protein
VAELKEFERSEDWLRGHLSEKKPACDSGLKIHRRQNPGNIISYEIAAD